MRGSPFPDMGKEESPNIANAKHDFPFVGLLKDCAKKKDLQQGSALHADILERRILYGKTSPYVGSALISMYAKCGALAKAQEVLETLPVRNVVSWNALIAGYTQRGHGFKALNCFERMQREGISPDGVTFTCILKACGSRGLIDKGKQIHEEICRKGLLKKYVFLGNALVDMYAKCGVLTKARKVLDELPVRNVVSWSSLISGYVQQGECHEALICYERMQNEGHSPNSVTFVCLLKACANIRAVEKGEKIHEQIVSGNWVEKDIALGTALIHMYSKCGMLRKAREILEGFPVRNAASWNALTSGYAEHGQYREALSCFEHMQSEGLSPDEVTFTCMLKACGSTGTIEKGKQIHEEIISRGLLQKDVVLGNAVVDMYAKCAMVTKAQEVLEELHVRDVATWNTLIAGYVQQGQYHEALNCFERMQSDGLSTNAMTYICILKACGGAGAIEKGIQIHKEIMGGSLLEKNMLLGNALVDMYAKCGNLAKAQTVLEELPIRNVVTWSSLVAGYTQQRDGHNALRCFEQMQSEGICPNNVTFSCLLSACCHSGQSNEAQMLFSEMTQNYCIQPNLEHQTSLVTIFGCDGQLDKAVEVIKAMPPSDSPAVWLTLLASCRKWGELKRGNLAFGEVIEIDVDHSAAYVLMANIFATSGMKDHTEKV